VRAKKPVHGKTSPISHDGAGVFHGLPAGFKASRYHSLVVSRVGLPADLEITARSPEGEIMGLRHRKHPVVGVQFHPEAVLTEGGYTLLQNFLQL
jgi:anthranilate synthase/aminodeoxychorismate synthase-like glutamine amidotransferase